MWREGVSVLGWAALSLVSDRCVYAGVAENSIYVAPEAAGRGFGRALLTALIGSAEAAGIWTIQTGIFPENEASLRLHESCGFRVVGVRERVGKHFGRWRDVVFVERRERAVRYRADHRLEIALCTRISSNTCAAKFRRQQMQKGRYRALFLPCGLGGVSTTRPRTGRRLGRRPPGGHNPLRQGNQPVVWGPMRA